MKTAELIIDSTDKNVDLYYATRFLCGDPFIYFRAGGRKYMMMTDLEIDRAKREAHVNTVLSLRKYLKKAERISKTPSKLDAVIVALKERKIKKLIVPESMSFTHVDYFRRKGFKVEAGPFPFHLARLKKNSVELKHVLNSQKAVFSAMKLAEDMIRKASIKKNMLFLDGKPLTSERVREAIELHLYKKGFISPLRCIVACGKDGLNPHNLGSGPLRPHQSIIVDIFPRSMKTLFYGDATRTFCKGAASAELKRLYHTVKTAQENAIGKIRAGVNGYDIHRCVADYFESQGYKTGEMDGRMQGFIHGTGHGIGLEIHEEPVRIKPVDYRLKEGFITSVEPGLYYKKIGGVRIEDLVYITKKRCKVLGYYPKILELS